MHSADLGVSDPGFVVFINVAVNVGCEAVSGVRSIYEFDVPVYVTHSGPGVKGSIVVINGERASTVVSEGQR